MSVTVVEKFLIPTTIVSSGTKSVNLGKVGHGIMLMTWTQNPVPDEVCFESMKASIDSVDADKGEKMLIVAGEFYGINPREANLELLARFFKKYPQYIDRTFISVKGSVNVAARKVDGSRECIRASVENILLKLDGTKKKIDLFEPARIDPDVPVETTVLAIKELIDEGKVDFIGLSECKASTLRRAHAVHPIAMVEIEVSPWSYEQNVKEVIDASEELGVAIAAYSPLGRGFLAGKYKTVDDFPEGDMRRTFDRFLPGNVEANKSIVEGIRAIADQKGITPAQLCIAWVCALGSRVIPIPGSSHVSRTRENTFAATIQLTPEEVQAVSKVLEDHPVKGDRYGPGGDAAAHLWG